ncbi:MAG: hypothetical protein QW594_03600 [Candidatus Woesearchaeota archaeon]
MGIDKKSEIIFIVLVVLLIPTIYVATHSFTKAKAGIGCTPVLYVDAGISPDSVENLVRDDQALCEKRCQSHCMALIGNACKGVFGAMYSQIYGVSCACELFEQDKDLADECIQEGKGLADPDNIKWDR